jgi:hypothetical protein
MSMNPTGLGAQRSDRDESGATMIMLAIVLVVLMIFAALAVDVGTAYSQRRQDQSAADAGAAAGGLKFLRTGDYEAAVADAKNIAAKNLTDAPSAADWSSCTDSGALPIASSTVAPVNGTPCISFELVGTRGVIKMRVRIPTVTNATAFAGVIGWHAMSTSASSVVKVGNPLGGVLPVYVLTGVQAGDQVCLISAAPGQNVPCTGQSGGNFGGFSPYYYQAPGCPPGSQTASGQYFSPAPAFAIGLDHLLSPYGTFNSPYNQPPVYNGPWDTTGVDQRLNGGAGCTVQGPNSVEQTQGNFSGVTNQAILSGNSSAGTGAPAYNGRLAGGPFSNGGTFNSATIVPKQSNAVQIDNAPLWYFLKSSVVDNNDYPLQCQAAAELSPKRDVAKTQLASVEQVKGLTTDGTTPAYTTPEALLSACLSNWTVADGELFDDSIGTTMRLGSVPRYWETQATYGAIGHIRDFVPVYFTGEFQAPGGIKDPYDPRISHYAGDPIPTNGQLANAWKNAVLAAEGGMFVPCASLPSTVCQTLRNDPSDNGLGGTLGGVTMVQ